MLKLFFIYSETVDLTNYTIKDIPGSSGRLDVISRCILASLIGSENKLEPDIQVWIFLEKYGTYVFDSNLLNYENFPKNEIKLTDFFVDIIRNENKELIQKKNPLNSVKILNISIIEALKQFIEAGYEAFILNEVGEDLSKYIEGDFKERKLIFVVGNQTGIIINSEYIKDLKLPNISLGRQSYLASSIIRLIKLKLKQNW